MKPMLGFIGAGRVATALALRLHEVGYEITGIYSRTLESAQKLAKQINVPALTTFPQADVLILAVPDDAISAVAAQIDKGFQPLVLDENIKAVIHLSGVHDSTILNLQHKNNIQLGSFHPLYPFRSGTHLTGTEEMLVAIEASNEWLEAVLVELAQAIGGQPAVVKNKALYHAAAVMASNYLVTLFEVSLRLMTQAGVPTEIAQTALAQLMQGNLDNLRQLPPSQALTGPIARGDVATIRQHLVALADTPYENLYRELGRWTAELAQTEMNLLTSKDS